MTLTEMSTRCKNAAELLKLLAKVKGISNRKLVVVNGITGVTYDIKEKDTTVLAFLTEKGRCMEFAFSPASDEDFMRYILLISSSIQNAEVKKKTEKSADSKAEENTASGNSEAESGEGTAEESEEEDRDEASGDSEEENGDETDEDSEEGNVDETNEDSEEGNVDETNEDSEDGAEEEGEQDEEPETSEDGAEDESYENAVG